jgi:4-hydroxyproline epimerase
MRMSFFCIDGHTAGNPVRLVAGGAPILHGASMSEKRADFMARYDHIRLGLMFEPRGHDMMSGGFLYPPIDPANDIAILFMETSGCLPMCGHGSIGMITFGLEHGLIQPKTPGRLRVEVPAGLIEAHYTQTGAKVTAVKLVNVPSFVIKRGIEINVDGLGPLSIDVSYGGNFYGIIEPQGNYRGIDDLGAGGILQYSPIIRRAIQAVYRPIHPNDSTIAGVSHLLWSDAADPTGQQGRCAVFYGDRAIDRSPCGTGTSARIAHLHSTGRLAEGQAFIHESIIRSRFTARIERLTKVGDYPAIIPSVEGQAYVTGLNTLWIDEDEPFPTGFQLI